LAILELIMDPSAVARIKLPADFVAHVNGILTPGATLFVIHEWWYPQTGGPLVQVVDADPPARAQRGGVGRRR
jgi:hypothetical protein